MRDKKLSLLFTGDLALIGNAESLPGQAYRLHISKEVKTLFNKFDLKIANLETPLTLSSKELPKTGIHLKAHPESIQILKDLTINVACLSNNHIRDFDAEGIAETIGVCKKNDIDVLGAGSDIESASKPLLIKVQDWHVAILNFSESEYNTATEIQAGSNPDDPIHIWRSFRSVKDKADFIIAVLHGGKEMHPFPTPMQLELFRFVVDLGADMVIGHHTHVIGGYEIYKNAPIIYSLGNFIFDEAGNPSGWYKGVLAGISFSSKDDYELEFYLTCLENNNLSVVDNQKIKPKESEKIFINRINKEIVKDEWDKIIKKQSFSNLRGLLHMNLMQRVLFKLGIKRLTRQDLKYLMSLGNKFRCQTHRRFSSDVINFLTRLK